MDNNLGNKQTMAKNIKYYMEKFDISRRKICDDLDIKYSTFSEWVSAKKYPRIDKIELMANYFGVEKSDLVEEPLIKNGKRVHTSARIILTEKESHLIDSYRRLDKDGQSDVIDYIDFRLSKSKSVLRDKPSTTIIDAPFQVRAAHAHDPNSDGSELKGDFDMLEEAVKNDKLRKNGKKD